MWTATRHMESMIFPSKPDCPRWHRERKTPLLLRPFAGPSSVRLSSIMEARDGARSRIPLTHACALTVSRKAGGGVL